LHDLHDALAGNKKLTGALQQTAVREQLDESILLAHQQLPNNVIDAQQKPSVLDRDEEEQQQQQQASCWQANLRLEHVGLGHRAYQRQQQQQQEKQQQQQEKQQQQQQQQQQQKHAQERQPELLRQPLCAIANRIFQPGELIGFYLSNVLDDQLYDLGGTIEERAYRQYIHHFSVTQPAFALRCEQQDLMVWQQQQQQQHEEQQRVDNQQQKEEQREEEQQAGSRNSSSKLAAAVSRSTTC
jgi:hypothetical protein